MTAGGLPTVSTLATAELYDPVTERFTCVERSVEGTLRMILVRDRSAEQREDSVASGLHDGTRLRK
jgi:hypothetical protein